jgi:hypothetical protein
MHARRPGYGPEGNPIPAVRCLARVDAIGDLFEVGGSAGLADPSSSKGRSKPMGRKAATRDV